MMVGRLLSFWEGPFSGAMLNFWGVISRSFFGKLEIHEFHPSSSLSLEKQKK